MLAPTRLEAPRQVAGEIQAPRISFDFDSYEPMHVMPVTHTLEHHPLLQLDALAAAVGRLSKLCTVRYHDDQASFGTNFVTAPESNPVHARPEQILASLESAKAWMSMLGVHRDPAYRGLLDQVLGSVQPLIDAKDPGMSYRRADIFVASPGAVTPYHMDHENNFILQVRGNKLLYVCEPLDREVVTERSLESFHATGSRDLVVYKDEFLDRAHKFQLEPGRGGYMPTTAPHWVKNGDNVSITISFTFYTSALRRREMLHRGDYYIRRLGLKPTSVGASPVLDSARYSAYRAIFAARAFANTLQGKPSENFDQQYGN